MLISIIIPVYNRAHIVQPTLSSVVAQSHRPLQVVLVDNASSDDTGEVLQQFKQQHAHEADLDIVLAHEPRHSAGAARNCGFAQATGEWVLFFDSDDLMDPDLVAAYVRCLQSSRQTLDMIGAPSTLVFPDGSRRAAPFHHHDLIAQHILHGQFATQRYAVRRAFFAQSQGWNPDLPVWNDYELSLRLLLQRPRLTLLSLPSLITINTGAAASITGTEFHSRHGLWERSLQLMLDHIGEANLPSQQRARYTRLLHYRQLVLAAHYEREGQSQLARPLCQQAYQALCESYNNSRRWRWVVAPVTRRLYARIVAGKRGSARVARKLF